MDTNLVKQKGTVANCLSHCIVSHLNQDGNLFTEKDLYCNKEMLTIYTSETNHYLTVPIEELIMKDIKKIGMTLQEEKNPNIDKLDYLLKNNNKVILNIDSKNLYYSETYTKTPTSLNYHFINVLSGSEGYYSIYDGYIPTLPISSYSGGVNLTEETIKKCKIYTIKYDELIKNDNNYKLENLLYSLENYKININKYNPFKSLKKKLSTGDLNSTTIFEIAVSLVGEGVFSTRILFFESVKSVIHLNEYVYNKYKNLKNNYFTLRLSLVKYSITKRKKDLENVINNIENIEATEYALFNQIEVLIKDKNRLR